MRRIKGRKRELSESGVVKKFTYCFDNIKRLTKSSWPERLCKSCDSQLAVCVSSRGTGGLGDSSLFLGDFLRFGGQMRIFMFI